jgi:hypothetical protein
MSTTSRPPHEATPDEEQHAIYFIIRTQNAEDEEQLFRAFTEAQQLLSDEISAVVSALLSPLFRFQEIEIRHGTVEIWVYLISGYTLISQYDDFRKGMERVINQIQLLLSRVVLYRFSGASVAACGWTPVATKPRRLVPSRPRFFQDSKDLTTLLMASYLILSHAVMLAVLLRIAVKVFLQTK